MIKFKNEKDKELFFLLNPILIMIYADLNHYAKSRYGIDLVLTETVTTLIEDEKINRTSSSHRQCRAIDIRTYDIDSYIVQDLINYINNKKEYFRYHYLKFSGGKTLAYLHTNVVDDIDQGEHIHMALHSQFAIK